MRFGKWRLPTVIVRQCKAHLDTLLRGLLSVLTWLCGGAQPSTLLAGSDVLDTLDSPDLQQLNRVFKPKVPMSG